MAEFEQALVLKFRISLGNRVMTDNKVPGQGANSRQFVPALKDARFDAVAYLLHQLQVERLSGRWIELKDHSTTVSVQ